MRWNKRSGTAATSSRVATHVTLLVIGVGLLLLGLLIPYVFGERPERVDLRPEVPAGRDGVAPGGG